MKLQSEEDGDNLPESPDAMYSNENNDIAKIVNDNDVSLSTAQSSIWLECQGPSWDFCKGGKTYQ